MSLQCHQYILTYVEFVLPAILIPFKWGPAEQHTLGVVNIYEELIEAAYGAVVSDDGTPSVSKVHT